MRLGTALVLGAGALGLACGGSDKSVTPDGGMDRVDGARVTFCRDDMKRSIIRTLGGESEGIQSFLDEYGRPCAIACKTGKTRDFDIMELPRRLVHM